MKIREEKNGNFWIFCTGMMLWYFMSGIEYGIILANINDYLLKGFGSSCSFLWERTLDNLSDICSIQAQNKWFKVSLWTENGPKLASKAFVYHQNRSFVVEFHFQKFRARNSLFLHEFEPKESRRATKVNWICIYIFRFFWAYIITNLRVNKNHRPVKSHSDGFINYLKYKINLYASKTSFWLFFRNFNFNFTRFFFEIFDEKFEFLTEFQFIY